MKIYANNSTALPAAYCPNLNRLDLYDGSYQPNGESLGDMQGTDPIGLTEEQQQRIAELIQLDMVDDLKLAIIHQEPRDGNCFFSNYLFEEETIRVYRKRLDDGTWPHDPRLLLPHNGQLYRKTSDYFEEAKRQLLELGQGFEIISYPMGIVKTKASPFTEQGRGISRERSIRLSQMRWDSLKSYREGLSQGIEIYLKSDPANQREEFSDRLQYGKDINGGEDFIAFIWCRGLGENQDDITPSTMSFMLRTLEQESACIGVYAGALKNVSNDETKAIITDYASTI